MTTNLRIPIPEDVAANVLFEHDRTCALCCDPKKPVQIHHIDDNRSNNNIANLVALCTDCHTETQRRGGFVRRLNAPLVILYRDAWLKVVKSKRDQLTSDQSHSKQRFVDPFNNSLPHLNIIGIDNDIQSTDEGELDENNENRPNIDLLLKKLTTLYRSIDSSSQISQRRNAYSLVDDLLYALRNTYSNKIINELPRVTKLINKTLWPSLDSAWSTHQSLKTFENELVVAYLSTNITLSRICRSNYDITRATTWFIETLSREYVQYSIKDYSFSAQLIWANYNTSNYENCQLLATAIRRFLMPLATQELTEEGKGLLLSLARLYVRVLKYSKRTPELTLSLKEAFNLYLYYSEETFWGKCLLLLASVYDDQKGMALPDIRKHFTSKFLAIRIDNVFNVARANIYLTLHSVYLDFLGLNKYRYYSTRIKLFDSLPNVVAHHPSIILWRLQIELSICRNCPREKFSTHFLRLEKDLNKYIDYAQPIRAQILRLKMLFIFAFRVIDKVHMSNPYFTNQSIIISIIRTNDQHNTFERYLGIPFKHVRIQGEAIKDVFKYLIRLRERLITEGLRSYVNDILIDSLIDERDLSRAMLDYIYFLNVARSIHPNQLISEMFDNAVSALTENAITNPRLNYYLAKICYTRAYKDIPKATHHWECVWNIASNFEKNRIACDYARSLYENHLYHERNSGETDSLFKLCIMTREFIDANESHFMSAYHGLSLLLMNENSRDEDILMIRLVNYLNIIWNKHYEEQYGNLNENISVYKSQLHNLLLDCNSQIAKGLILSLDTPEIYNTIGTYLITAFRPSIPKNNLRAAIVLYDIAIGMSMYTEYYTPKYEFNRLRCDFIQYTLLTSEEMEAQVQRLIDIINILNRLRNEFLWVYNFTDDEFAPFIVKNIERPMIKVILSHPNYESKWHFLRASIKKTLRKLEMSIPLIESSQFVDLN